MQLLQALNDQNQAAIDERLATEGVKGWINHRALPEQLDNPIRHFQDIKSITCLIFASVVSDDATVRQLVEAGADIAVTDSRGFSPLHYACQSFAYLVSDDAAVDRLFTARSNNAVTDSGHYVEVFSELHYACASNVDADATVAYLMQRDASSQTANGGS